MYKLFVLSVLVACCSAKYLNQYQGHGHHHYQPEVVKKVVVEPHYGASPYEFGYEVNDGKGNVHGRHESGDAAGNKAGSYSLSLADGRQRYVDYVADGNGFKAVVRSNEQGTDASQAPADVKTEAYGAPALHPDAKPEVKELKVVQVSPSYNYDHGHGHNYGHAFHGKNYGNGYNGGYYKSYVAPAYSYGNGYHGQRSKTYSRSYVAPAYFYGQGYRGQHSKVYRKSSAAPSYSYGNSYQAPAYSYGYRH